MTLPLPPLTLGIEEEYQIINPQTRDLHASIADFLSHEMADELKAEFMQSQVEVGSRVCRNVQEVRQELIRLRGAVNTIAADNNLAIAAASTHPFARWGNQNITDGDRYRELLDDLQGIGRRLIIFGMHIHVGFDHDNDPEKCDLMIEVMNQARYFIPHLLALTTSSPFWQGEDTGLKSYRSVVFETLPRTGIPYAFSSWREYKQFENTLSKAGSFGKLDKTAKIWWDIRPHPKFPTLELRICDVCTRIDEAVCIAALFQAICAKIIKLRMQNLSWRPYRHMHITENKWRALRYGINNTLIDFGREEEIPFSTLADELLELVDDVVDELGSRAECETVHTIIANGTSADRQLRVYDEQGGDDNRQSALEAVVDHLIMETKEGLKVKDSTE